MKKSDFVLQTQKRLLMRREALRRMLAGDERVLRSHADHARGDEVDAAIATEQAELCSQMASMETRELAQIEKALERIRRGRYGRCEVCDKPISATRLKALPYATECIACARRGENQRPSFNLGSGRVAHRLARHGLGEDDTAADDAYDDGAYESIG
jgi:DnaK suppressor protein